MAVASNWRGGPQPQITASRMGQYPNTFTQRKYDSVSFSSGPCRLADIQKNPDPVHNKGVLGTAFVTTTTQPMKEQQILQTRTSTYDAEELTNQVDEFIEGQYWTIAIRMC